MANRRRLAFTGAQVELEAFGAAGIVARPLASLLDVGAKLFAGRVLRRNAFTDAFAFPFAIRKRKVLGNALALLLRRTAHAVKTAVGRVARVRTRAIAHPFTVGIVEPLLFLAERFRSRNRTLLRRRTSPFARPRIVNGRTEFALGLRSLNTPLGTITALQQFRVESLRLMWRLHVLAPLHVEEHVALVHHPASEGRFEIVVLTRTQTDRLRLPHEILLCEVLHVALIASEDEVLFFVEVVVVVRVGKLSVSGDACSPSACGGWRACCRWNNPW
jgi:hypothetical protein